MQADSNWFVIVKERPSAHCRKIHVKGPPALFRNNTKVFSNFLGESGGPVHARLLKKHRIGRVLRVQVVIQRNCKLRGVVLSLTALETHVPKVVVGTRRREKFLRPVIEHTHNAKLGIVQAEIVQMHTFRSLDAGSVEYQDPFVLVPQHIIHLSLRKIVMSSGGCGIPG